MATLIELVESRSVRVNTGQYEGTEVFVSMKVQLDELDDEAAEQAALTARVEKAILMGVYNVHAAGGKKPAIKAIAVRHGLNYNPDWFKE